ncbi:MAG: hypothetical protein AAGA11_09640 [Pseudomonadota bacterium]
MSSREQSQATDRILGAVCLVFALVLAFIWIPLDAETGLIEKARRRLVIGDGLAPTVAAGLLAVSGLWLCLSGWWRRSGGALHRENLGFLLRFGGLVVLCLLVMRWAGPVAVWASGDTLDAYRLLRDTAPWKYLGYLLGGTLLIAGVVAWIERGLRWRSVALAFAVVLALALLYDLPFEDLLLPPNGDV